MSKDTPQRIKVNGHTYILAMDEGLPVGTRNVNLDVDLPNRQRAALKYVLEKLENGQSLSKDDVHTLRTFGKKFPDLL